MHHDFLTSSQQLFFVSSPRQKPPMNRHLTYRPQPAQIPADSFRADPCDTRDPRRFPCNLRRHVSPAHLILNSSFFILNWSYTFSAKEKDPETGLSYFGSRYYSSDLSVWLSVDPMSDKYPSLSPYVYCANNPVRCVDPNGEEINPIFSTSGELLGTDSKGWKGTAIVMDKKDFKKGMKHEDALKKGTELDKYGKGIKISDKDWKTVEEKGGERMSPYVKNHSGETIYFKPETTYGEYKNDGAYPLGAGKDLYMPVDGIAVPHLKKNQVYKITDNTRVSVSNTSISYQAVNRIIMGARGGWKGNFWHGFRTTDFSIVGDIRYPIRPADHSWDALFATSKR